MSILEEIVANKRREVAEREARASLDLIKDRAAQSGDPRPLKPTEGVGLIAEVKRRSPSAGELASQIEPAQLAKIYASAGAAAISVLTDERYFGGSFQDLEDARSAVSVPVLCKDFILTPYQLYEARSHGADLVLLIVAAIDDRALRELRSLAADLGMTALIEVHDQHDLARAIAVDAQLIGINNRDLSDFSVNLLTTEYLAPLVPDGVLIVSESGITSAKDVERVRAAGAHMVLVGEALLKADDPAGLIRELRGSFTFRP